MVTLQLEQPAPSPPKPETPIARKVVLWVGVSDSVLAAVRDNLPKRTRAMLDSAEMGFPPLVRINGDSPIPVRRIRYDKVPLGYGILIAEWMTIATKVSIAEHMSGNIAKAMTVLRVMGLMPRMHLTDQQPS